MARCEAPSKQLLQSLRKLSTDPAAQSRRGILRPFSTSITTREEAEADAPSKPSFRRNPDPQLVSSRRLERRLVKANNPPIGSRRRRLALQDTSGIPFEQLPYQCFQEARKILIADREEKLKQIETDRARIIRLRDSDPALSGGEARKKQRLKDMIDKLEHLKIMADINDPLVKRRFEDGLGDMNKPIYRYLAERKWREARRLVLMQRITQMKVIPDVLPIFEPAVDVKLAFVPPITFSKRGLEYGDMSKGIRSGDFHYVQPGDFVDSQMSENPCWLNVQSFERGERLVSVVVVDSDVPNLQKDGFDYRCHFLASNIPITPLQRTINLSNLSKSEQLLLPWIPPHAQKGSPYHRLSVFVLQQKDNIPMDLLVASKHVKTEGFVLRSFVDRHLLKPIGVHLFRTKWDAGTGEVMRRAGLEGADMELRRIKVEPLPYKRRNPSSFR